MRIVINEFISLDGVVQAPGGADEDRDGGFQHGGWSMPYFDMEIMGPSIDEGLQRADALLFGRRTWQVMAGAWPDRAGDPFANRMNSIEKHVVVEHLDRGRTHVGADLAHPGRRPRPGRDRDCASDRAVT
jgi:dihydrofolate reductase